MKFIVAFNGLILYQYLRLANFPFSGWILTCLKKNPSVKLYFSKELSFLRNNISPLIGTPFSEFYSSKIPDQELSLLTIKGNIWYIYNFLKAMGNNIKVLFLIFD